MIIKITFDNGLVINESCIEEVLDAGITRAAFKEDSDVWIYNKSEGGYDLVFTDVDNTDYYECTLAQLGFNKADKVRKWVRMRKRINNEL